MEPKHLNCIWKVSKFWVSFLRSFGTFLSSVPVVSFSEAVVGWVSHGGTSMICLTTDHRRRVVDSRRWLQVSFLLRSTMLLISIIQICWHNADLRRPNVTWIRDLLRRQYFYFTISRSLHQVTDIVIYTAVIYPCYWIYARLVCFGRGGRRDGPRS